MTTLVQWIDHQSWFHGLVRMLRIRSLVSVLLGVRPWCRTYPSGTRVELADLESFYLSDEIFVRETYRRAVEQAGEVRTVVDLGCNAGFFCCYLRHYFGPNDFRGFGVDANPTILKRAQRNLQLNGMDGIRLFHGLVGAEREASTEDFYLYASHLGSSQFVQPETGKKAKGGYTRIEVPVLKASELWRAGQGDARIDLLKIDIEGSEGSLLRDDPDLFRQAKCLVLEWHKWLVKEEKLFPALRDLGFTTSERLETGAGGTTELWFFHR